MPKFKKTRELFSKETNCHTKFIPTNPTLWSPAETLTRQELSHHLKSNFIENLAIWLFINVNFDFSTL